MPRIFPFKAHRFNKEKLGKIDDVVTPPYDQIGTREVQEKFYNKHPNNICRIIKGMDESGDNETNNIGSRIGDKFNGVCCDK